MTPAGENLDSDPDGLCENYREERERRLRPRGNAQDLGQWPFRALRPGKRA